MPEAVTHELKTIDERILKALDKGRNVPSNLAEELDVSRQWINQRLQQMVSADYARNVGRGVYELNSSAVPEDDRTRLGLGDTDEPDLRARLQDALEARDDAQDRADRLDGDLEDCQEQLTDCRERLDQADSVDAEAIGEALDALKRALERLPEDAPGRMALADAQALLEGATGDE